MATPKWPIYRYNAKGEVAVCDNPEGFERAKAQGFTLIDVPRGTGSAALYDKDGNCVLASTVKDKERLMAQGFGEEYVAPKKPEPEAGLAKESGKSSLDSEAIRAFMGEIGDLRARCDFLEARIEALESLATAPKKKQKPEEQPAA